MDSILVADADVSTVETVALAAAEAGLRVIIAENGIEALERFREENPRFVVVDSILPSLDGVQVCQKIRASLPGTSTVLVLTGSLIGDNEEKLRTRLRLSDLLEKPFRTADLLRSINPYLTRPDEAAGPVTTAETAELQSVVKLPVSRLFSDAVAASRTGALVWRSKEIERRLYLSRGEVIGADSNSRRDLWPAWASRDPQLGPAARSHLSALTNPGPESEGWKRYLVDRHAMTADEYRASRDRWLLTMSLDLMSTSEGSIGFIDDIEPEERLGPLEAKPLMFHGLRATDGAIFAELLPAQNRKLTTVATPETLATLHLTPVEKQLVSLSDGTESIGDLQALARLIQHDIRPLLYGLLSLGLVTASSDINQHGSPDGHPSATSDAGLLKGGRLETKPLLSTLTALNTAGHTGMLQLKRGDQKTTIHISRGKVIFARTNQEKHKLGNVLLRAGKVAMEDHGRALALQAVQTERRIGSILLGLGALSVKELHQGLAAQVMGILIDSLSWDTGDYAFILGDLPTDDSVSLDASPPKLLLDAWRASTNVPAIDHFLGEIDLPLEVRWKSERLETLVSAIDLDRAVVESVERGCSVRALLIAHGDCLEVRRAVAGLIGIGAIVANPKGAAISESSGPETVSAPTVTTTQMNSLRAANEQLRARVVALEEQNRRLRAALSTSETVVG